MLLLLVFVFQVPTSPVGAPASFEASHIPSCAAINFSLKRNKSLLLLGGRRRSRVTLQPLPKEAGKEMGSLGWWDNGNLSPGGVTVPICTVGWQH